MCIKLIYQNYTAFTQLKLRNTIMYRMRRRRLYLKRFYILFATHPPPPGLLSFAMRQGPSLLLKARGEMRQRMLFSDIFAVVVVVVVVVAKV